MSPVKRPTRERQPPKRYLYEGEEKEKEKQPEEEKPEESEEEESDSDEEEDPNLYCICKGRDDGTFMIACDECEDWFHGKCVGITKAKASKLPKYVCPNCTRAGRKRDRQASTLEKNEEHTDENMKEDLLSNQEDSHTQEEAKEDEEEPSPMEDEENEKVNNNQGGENPPTKVERSPKKFRGDSYEANNQHTQINSPPAIFREYKFREKKTIKLLDIPKTRMQEPKIDSTRLTFRSMLTNSLVTEGDTGPIAAEIDDLANEIEERLYEFFGSDSSSREYKQKVRSIVFNLKDQKNNLRQRVLSSEIKPDTLCRMSSEEMANEELATFRRVRESKILDTIVIRGGDNPIAAVHFKEALKEAHNEPNQDILPPIISPMTDTDDSINRPIPKQEKNIVNDESNDITVAQNSEKISNEETENKENEEIKEEDNEVTFGEGDSDVKWPSQRESSEALYQMIFGQ